MLEICGVNGHTGEKSQIGLCFMSFCDDAHFWNAALFEIPQYASEDAELLLVGNKLDCETDREISRQQGEKFAQQITGMRFCEASAKDNFNVDEIFLKLVDDILKKMPLDILRNELSNSILSLQPEPEIPPELPPPRPHVRCCWFATLETKWKLFLKREECSILHYNHFDNFLSHFVIQVRAIH